MQGLRLARTDGAEIPGKECCLKFTTGDATIGEQILEYVKIGSESRVDFLQAVVRHSNLIRLVLDLCNLRIYEFCV